MKTWKMGSELEIKKWMCKFFKVKKMVQNGILIQETNLENMRVGKNRLSLEDFRSTLVQC